MGLSGCTATSIGVILQKIYTSQSPHMLQKGHIQVHPVNN